MRLILEYTPADRAEQREAEKLDPACEVQDPERPPTLTATGKGGDLTLTCVGCNEQAGRSIQVEFQ
jgi:hypothetical protein